MHRRSLLRAFICLGLDLRSGLKSHVGTVKQQSVSYDVRGQILAETLAFSMPVSLHSGLVVLILDKEADY